MLIAALIGAGSGFGLQKLKTPNYTAGVSILLDPKRPGVYGADAQFANAMADTTKIGSIVPLISSTLLLSRVIKSEKLTDNPDFAEAQPSVVRQLLSHLPFLTLKPELNTPEIRDARTLYRLRQAVRAERVGMTYIIDIRVTTRNPADAKRLADAVGNAYLEDQMLNQRLAAKTDAEWLAKQLDQLRIELTTSEESVETIRQKYGLTDTGPNQDPTIYRQVIADLNTQLSHAEGDVASWRGKFEQVERVRLNKGNLEDIPEVVASQQMGKFHQELSDLNRRIADMTAHYTPSYPDLVRARRDKTALESQINAEVFRIGESIHNELRAAVVQRDYLKTVLDRAIATVNDTSNSKGRIELKEAQRIAEADRALYEAQLVRLRQIREQQTRQDVEARIISPAEYPDPSKSGEKVAFTAAGLIFGLLVGSGISLVALLRETKFVSAEWAESTLNVPILGTLPLIRRSHLVRMATDRTVTGYLKAQPFSQFAECVRLLRISLRTASDRPIRIIQVTSAVPGEGKSTVAASLAMSAATAGVKTVLVDLDMRHPSVSRIFDIESDGGVADVLEGRSPISGALLAHSDMPLTIVGTGTVPRLRPDIVDTPRLGNLIRELTNDFDLVILDSPPVLAVSDAILISSVADATVLVVQWQATPRDIVKQAAKLLRSNRSRLIGLVMNKADQARADNYPGARYGAYYQSQDVDFGPNAVPKKYAQRAQRKSSQEVA